LIIDAASKPSKERRQAGGWVGFRDGKSRVLQLGVQCGEIKKEAVWGGGPAGL
jgi:hypothetical protein